MYSSIANRGIRRNPLTAAFGLMCPVRIAKGRQFLLAFAERTASPNKSSVSISIPRVSIVRSHSQPVQHRALHFVSKRRDGLRHSPRGDENRSNLQQSGVGSLP